MAAAVVVEVGEDLTTLRPPLADPVGPPAQVIVGIGPGVEVVRIGAVKTDVDDAGGRAQEARQLRAAGDTVRRPVASEDREGFLPGPARMAELHRDSLPR